MNFETLISLSNGELAARITKTSIVNELCTYEQCLLLCELQKRQSRREVKRADLTEAIDIVANETGQYYQMSIWSDPPERTYTIDRTRRYEGSNAN